MKVEEMGLKRGNGKLPASLRDPLVTLSSSIIMMSGVPLWVIVDMHRNMQRWARRIKVLWRCFWVCAMAACYSLCLLHLLSQTIRTCCEKLQQISTMMWTCYIYEMQSYYLLVPHWKSSNLIWSSATKLKLTDEETWLEGCMGPDFEHKNKKTATELWEMQG